MKDGLAVFALALLTLGVYAQTLAHDFIGYDDPVYVTENPMLREGPSPSGIARAFLEPYEANWIPLTWISLQIDYALFGLDAGGYHATNLVLHLLASWLLFFALQRASGDFAPSLFVAAVFAIHPLHVESVAWISERKDTLSGAWFAGTLWLYAGYAQRPSALRYSAVVLATAGGLLAKPMLVTLPCVLLLLDHWPLRRLDSAAAWRRAVLEKLPLLLLAAAASAATLYAQQRYGSMEHGDLLSLGVRLGNALVAIAAYLGDAVWPAGLSIFYPHPEGELSASAVAASALLLLALTAGSLAGFRRAPWLTVGWLWFVGMLVPVLGLVQVGMQSRADRYTYLPLIGATIAVAWSVDRGLTGRRGRTIAAGAATLAVLALAAAAHQQAGHWRDTESLFGHATRVDPDNWFAHQWMGSERLLRGALDEAEASFRQAMKLRPEWSSTHRGLADVHAERGEWAEAIRSYERAIRLTPRQAQAHIRLARALAASGQLAEALGRGRHAVSLAEGRERAEALVILGFIHLERGEAEPALRVTAEAAELAPDLPAAHTVQGLSLLRLGRTEEARRRLDRALAVAEAAGDLATAEQIRALRP